MTQEQFAKLFKLRDNEYLKFDRVVEKRSDCPDLHAFLILDGLVGNPWKMIGGAEHDQIHLATDVGKLRAVVTEEQVVELIRCGVRYDEDNDSLCMFV